VSVQNEETLPGKMNQRVHPIIKNKMNRALSEIVSFPFSEKGQHRKRHERIERKMVSGQS